MADHQINRRELPALVPQLHENTLIQRVLAHRGVESAAQLDYALADLPRPDALLGIDAACDRLMQALQAQEAVLVIGDYDCDGATSTTLAVLGLRAMGFESVDYLVPNRFEFGYGLSPAIVDVAAAMEPSLIVTVDNGVASVEGVERARKFDIDVIITDHHLPPAVLPNAVSIVNPNIPGATFPSKNLAGVGVCFYVLLALRTRINEQRSEQGEPLLNVNMAEFLDLVAIGTVADVVPLDATNRTLVEQGLRRIRKGFCRPGVQALISQAGRVAERLHAADIGFAVGPRLNAAGRLADISKGIECLLTDDAVQAHHLAIELDELNKKRRSIEQSMRADAEAVVQAAFDSPDLDSAGQCALVLFDENWHQGVIGILAGRLKEQLHKPVVIFAADGEHGIKGSARSIAGVHIRDVLDTVATNNPELIDKFGGHAMAAGLSLSRDNFTQFCVAFENTVSEVLGGQLPARQWLSDGSLSDTERCLDNATLLDAVSPWGQGFEAPVFDDVFLVESSRVVGTNHLKLRLRSVPSDDNKSDYGERFDAIAFNQAGLVSVGAEVQVVYALAVNHYRGERSLQLMVHHMHSTGV